MFPEDGHTIAALVRTAQRVTEEQRINGRLSAFLAAPATLGTLRMGQCNVKKWVGGVQPQVEHSADPLGVLDLTRTRHFRRKPTAASMRSADHFGRGVAFLFADLLILRILNIYRRYDGVKMMLVLSATFDAGIVLVTGLTPQDGR